MMSRSVQSPLVQNEEKHSYRCYHVVMFSQNGDVFAESFINDVAKCYVFRSFNLTKYLYFVFVLQDFANAMCPPTFEKLSSIMMVREIMILLCLVLLAKMANIQGYFMWAALVAFVGIVSELFRWFRWAFMN